jgi:hypothetical protein
MREQQQQHIQVEQPEIGEQDNISDISDESDDPLLLHPYNNMRVMIAHASTINATPQSYHQARQSSEWDKWETAMKEELAKMDSYNVWEVVDRLPNQRVVDGKWVYTKKINGVTGKAVKHKARWVAKGFKQIEGIDYNELFSAVAHKDSVRLFLALVNYYNMECDQVDIIAAFLNGDLEETIYMSPPEGSDISSNKVLLLRKTLYGLKQSPRCFNIALDTWLQGEGLKPLRADSCVYIKRDGDNILMLTVHVDDQLIACNNRSYLDNFKQKLNAKFECKDGGPVNYFLGFNVFRDREKRKLHISQEHYMEALLDRFDLTNANPARNPFPSHFKPVPATDDEHVLAKHLPYPQMAGAILYAATISRPDLSYYAGVLARYISKWNLEHYKAAKHLLRYIRGTTDLCLTFDATGGQRMVLGYADADWGGDLDTRRSTTGYVFKVFGGVIAWKSKRQSTVALSTMEAEYMSSADCARQAVWLRLWLEDIGLGLGSDPLPILNDNNGAIALAKNPVNHERSKHIGMRHHFLREKIEEKVISLEHVRSAENLADLLTKGLPRETFDHLRDGLGVMERSEQVGVSEI